MVEDSLPARGVLDFTDVSTGWLGGPVVSTNAIYKYVGCLTGIKDVLKKEDKMTIVPNPASSEAVVIFPTIGNFSQGNLSIKIFSMDGRLLDVKAVNENSDRIRLDAEKYSSGLYMIELNNQGQRLAREKWVVQH